MKTLALQLPFFGQIDNPPNLKFSGNEGNLGSILSGMLNIAFYVGAFLAFYYLIWGAFQYIVASGDKEQLGKARNRITWAIVGLLVIFSAYILTKYGSEIFGPGPDRLGVPF